jgi:hypothetical protein
MLLGIIWGQHHLPLSPFFLLFLLHVFDAVVDVPLIQAIAPEAGQRLLTWPPQSIATAGRPELELSFGCDPMNMIIEHLPHLQVCLHLQATIHN